MMSKEEETWTPRAIRLSIATLWAQALLAIPVTIGMAIIYLMDSSASFAGVALLGAALYGPPAVLFAVAAIGAGRRRRWGYRVALAVHGSIAILGVPLAAIVLLGMILNPAARFSVPVVATVVAILLLAIANATAAVGLIGAGGAWMVRVQALSPGRRRRMKWLKGQSLRANSITSGSESAVPFRKRASGREFQELFASRK